MSKHTPGPWCVSAGKFLEIRKDAGIPVLLATMTEHLPINGIDQEANARLMAAAPELLAAAKALTDHMPGWDYDPEDVKEYRALRDAIAKAGGL